MERDLQDETRPIIPPKSVNHAFPIGAAILSAIGGLLFGYDTGVISGAMIQLRQQFALSYFYQELIVSITLGSAAIAALSSASLTDWAGRKPIIIFASFVFTIGAVILGAAFSKEALLGGRLVVGFGIGMASMVVPVYIAEVSPSVLRGTLVTLNTVCITAGQMIAAIVDGIFMSDTLNGWRYMLALGGIPSAIQFLGFFMMPESPRWLVHHGRTSDARSVLMRIHGRKETSVEIERELERIVIASESQDRPSALNGLNLPNRETAYDEDQSSAVEQQDSTELLTVSASGNAFFDRLTIVRMLRQSSTRRALMVGCCLQLFQQLVGINTVMYYSASIISMAGVGSSSDAKSRDTTVVWMAAVVASANCAFCLISPWLISRFRRRTLLLCSLSGVLISLIVLGISFQTIACTSSPVTLIEPLPPGFPPTDCLKAFTCDSCMRTSMCGFCYNQDRGRVVNGSCLPAPEKFAEFSSYGRCSNESSVDHRNIWAFDHCPTPYGWLTMFGLVMYLASFSPGMASLPWTINSELYPTWARSTGVACATGTNWIANVLVSLTFLSLTEAITRQGTYFLYAAITLLAIFFVHNLVPETGGITLEEVN
ncbi:MFS transporter, SP family, solute carrier family 2 (myo-inositol transporter), member 13 [Paragonimus westermani]|uniref:MFS transporter, SP family, solute carrier family 2 (Myo-inositol transporter), member 13 n=1 Tax=Paragonimus westermani TaxID=34504 RepID=A0A5J4NPU8_9TREM|nr:MFS transporter, SP family, solute carrier family 2 (myo-inositol transporter), member 13 [Paragonimus westermani]